MHFCNFVTHQGSELPFQLNFEPFYITRDDKSHKHVTITLKSLYDNLAEYSLDSTNWPGFDEKMLFGVMDSFLNRNGYRLIIN
jgi:hypothetical protein